MSKTAAADKQACQHEATQSVDNETSNKNHEADVKQVNKMTENKRRQSQAWSAWALMNKNNTVVETIQK